MPMLSEGSRVNTPTGLGAGQSGAKGYIKYKKQWGNPHHSRRGERRRADGHLSPSAHTVGSERDTEPVAEAADALGRHRSEELDEVLDVIGAERDEREALLAPLSDEGDGGAPVF